MSRKCYCTIGITTMINNIKQLESSPIARTNMVKLGLSSTDTIRKLLRSDSNLYQVDFGYRYFKKARGERYDQFYKRLHVEVKHLIRSNLCLDDKQDVKYELTNLGKGYYAYFFLNHAFKVGSQEHIELESRISELIAKLSESGSLNKLVGGLFSLRIKMALLEKTSDIFETEASYFNSEIYLNARYSALKGAKKGKGVIEAFKLSVYASEQNELAFSLHKNKFLVNVSNEMRVNLDDESIWFNTVSGKQDVNRKLDARDSKLLFFKDRSLYGESQAYTLNVVMNMVQKCLEQADISHQDITFQATHEVDSFSTDLDASLSNQLYVVESSSCFTDTQRQSFTERLQETFPQAEFISSTEVNKISNSDNKCSFLVLNPINDGKGNSIHSSNAQKSSDEFSGFWQAFEQYQKDPSVSWDLYTNLKLNRLESWLKESPFNAPLQGMNIDSKLLADLDYIEELKNDAEANYEQDLSNFRSKLRKCINSLDTKFKRVKTELWFKESLLTLKRIESFPHTSGHYTAFYIRAPKYNDMLVSHVEVKLDGESATIVSNGVITGDDDWVKAEYPELDRVTKFFDGSFYLYDHQNDVLLTSYTSGRVPKIIGSASFDSVEWYLHQEDEKHTSENKGDSFNDYLITRTYKTDKNVLPYYLVQGRSKSDPLAKSNKLKHHRIYLMPHKEGLYYLVTHAQPANATIAKQNLIENLILWDANGDQVEPFNHPLTGAFLNSFTLDMLKSGESSKSSIFIKLAKLLIEN